MSLFKFKIFEKCIFCDEFLPIDITGVGEHVIPESLNGFWRIYDVCPCCMKFFGDAIDGLGIKNPSLLGSMKILGMNKVEKYYTNIPFKAYDVETNEPVAMIRRGGDFKHKVKLEGDTVFECSERDMEKLGFDWIKRNNKEPLSDEEIKREWASIKDKYGRAKIGDIVHSDVLKIGMKKRQAHKIEFDFANIPEITPLIAKIMFCAVHYFIPLDVVGSFVDYHELRNYIRFGGKLRDYTINECNLRKTSERYSFHRIRFEKFGHALIVDVTFFGYDNWRSILPCDKEVYLLDEQSNEIEILNLYLDFSEGKKSITLSFISKNKDYREFHIPF